MKRFLGIILILVLLAATAGTTYVLTSRELAGSYAPSETVKKIEEIEQYLEHFFIDDYSETEIGDAAATALIQATGDEWSYYISAADYNLYLEQMNNAYVGIGVTISPDADMKGFKITSVTPRGPAAESGVQVDDYLMKVEGDSAYELGQEETVNRVRGEEGTEITLTFLRDGHEFDLTLIRSSIATEVTSYTKTDDGIAIIKIANFDGHCAQDTIAAIERALQEDAQAILFDVRNNPGGMKDEMVEILDYLLPEGDLFRSIDYAGREEIDKSEESFVDIPMGVLVNEDSYSAAEFFAAAMQEYDAATIIGMQTYGKGNFQSTFRLSDGSAIAISIGKYFTPNGVSLTGIGITPDIEVDVTDEQYAMLYYNQLPMDEDPQMQAALEALR